jgi:hypothetical protein
MWNKIKTILQTIWLGLKKAFISSLKWLIPISIIAVIAFFVIKKLSDPTDSDKEFQQLIDNFKVDWQSKKSDINNQVAEMDKQMNQIKKDQADRQSQANNYIKIKPKI